MVTSDIFKILGGTYAKWVGFVTSYAVACNKIPLWPRALIVVCMGACDVLRCLRPLWPRTLAQHVTNQPVTEVLAYLHVQVSPISCWVVGSILASLLKNTDTAIVGDRCTGGGGTPRPVLLTGAKKSHLGWLISFELPMGFQNFVVINKIHPLTNPTHFA